MYRIIEFFLIVVGLFSPIRYAKIIGVNIGKNCRIVTRNWGSEPYLIHIGNHVHITKGVTFINHDGAVWVFRDEIPDFDVFGKIYIGDNTYVGNSSFIMPGVTIGSNCVIGACSLITKNIPDNSVVAGVPAKYICSTEHLKEKLIPLNTQTKKLTHKQKKQVLTESSFNKFIIKTNLSVIK